MVKIESDACKPIAQMAWAEDFLVSESCPQRSGSVATIRCKDEGHVLFTPQDDIMGTDFIHLKCREGEWEPIGEWSCQSGTLEEAPVLFHDDAPKDPDTATAITDSPSDLTESSIFEDDAFDNSSSESGEVADNQNDKEMTEIEKSSPAAISLFV